MSISVCAWGMRAWQQGSTYGPGPRSLTIPLLFLSIIEKQNRDLSSMVCSFWPTAYAAMRYSRKLIFLFLLRSRRSTSRLTFVSVGSMRHALATSVVSKAMSPLASRALKFCAREGHNRAVRILPGAIFLGGAVDIMAVDGVPQTCVCMLCACLCESVSV